MLPLFSFLGFPLSQFFLGYYVWEVFFLGYSWLHTLKLCTVWYTVMLSLAHPCLFYICSYFVSSVCGLLFGCSWLCCIFSFSALCCADTRYIWLRMCCWVVAWRVMHVVELDERSSWLCQLVLDENWVHPFHSYCWSVTTLMLRVYMCADMCSYAWFLELAKLMFHFIILKVKSAASAIITNNVNHACNLYTAESVYSAANVCIYMMLIFAYQDNV